MGGGNDDHCNRVARCAWTDDVTLVLVGKVGYGKSATANSILGCNAFESKRSYASVTGTCQMRSTSLRVGNVIRTANVIDTPGLFDMGISVKEAGKEITKSMDMAKEGMHAMLMVLTAASRLSPEDEETMEYIKLFFGDKIVDHMIFVFTNGDQVQETDWKSMLDNSAPGYLKDMIRRCKNRVILFDNKTKDIQKRDAQLKQLLNLVNSVILSNCGKPFSNLMFTHMKKAHDKLKELDAEGCPDKQTSELKKARCDEYLAPINKMDWNVPP
ncbi:hypothetical protein PR202_gb15580 [Eleusine coracana subsp. coracana]|uniref:AIG1-type G domain-containing protein n=1 Tax=Eleusine coracana subsp. coracana TaxID=191504 RepID=A0AAV5EZB5_ELECO|nr:hypothetical protein PR202_gb15580 [Eleusine coracana subsp. coracana]